MGNPQGCNRRGPKGCPAKWVQKVVRRGRFPMRRLIMGFLPRVHKGVVPKMGDRSGVPEGGP